MSTHGVRALAFHHEKGYQAQRELALKFAGEDGRIATMEDIVHARLHASLEDFVWTRVIITGSHVFVGWNGAAPTLVFAHGVGPQPMLRGNESIISKEEFAALIAGEYGEVESIDLRAYCNKSKHKHASNRYTYEVAREDPIIRAFFGSQVDAFLDHYHKLTQDWLEEASLESKSDAVLLINRIYPLYEGYSSGGKSFGHIPAGYARAHPLTIDAHGLYTSYDNKQVHLAAGIDFSASTNSGIDDLGGPAYYIVGIRGKEPVVDIVPEFRVVTGRMKELWPQFVQPLDEVSHDPYVGIKPDGSRERPYYILNRWHTKPVATGRIQENGTASEVPEYRIKSAVRIEAPPTVTFKKAPYNPQEGFPYTGMWDALKAAMPSGANAIACGSSCHFGGSIEASVSYWHIELDEEPFRILMKCGKDFFSQYNDHRRTTHQPHLLVEEAELLGKKLGWRIPDEVYQSTLGRRHDYPVLSLLIANAPPGTNAMWIKRESVGYQEKAGRNVMYVSVYYYKARFADKAFRPFTELRSDFDWILDRRAQAGLLNTEL